jgi:hypothetical protein
MKIFEKEYCTLYKRLTFSFLPNCPYFFQWQLKVVIASHSSFLYILYIIELVLVLNIAEVRTKKLVFCRGYNTLFQKFSRGLERAESLALAKHVTHCDPRQGVPYYNPITLSFLYILYIIELVLVLNIAEVLLARR